MIAIRNIYYMLSYAFRVLQGQGYKKIATEDFENAADLCAAILVLGVTSQVKRGLGQSYIVFAERMISIHKKPINMGNLLSPKSISGKIDAWFFDSRRQLSCI